MQDKSYPVEVDVFVPNWRRACNICSTRPCVQGLRDGRLVFNGNLCGPCTFGEAKMSDPARWNDPDGQEELQ